MACEVSGCDRPVYVRLRGLCQRHYNKWKTRGTVEPWIRPPAEDRFWPKVDQHGPGGCWLWDAGLHTGGYGHFYSGDGERYAHRFAYKLLVGPIPEGTELDHLCRVRRCVNPDHLEPVTRRENLLRGDTFAARNVAKTHCSKGHPYDEANTYRNPSGGGRHRSCRSCHRITEKARKGALRALRPPIGWARNYAQCRECGTIERPHRGLGLCRSCYLSDYMRRVRDVAR